MMCIFFRDDDWNVDEARARESIGDNAPRTTLLPITFRLNNAGAPNRKTLLERSKKRRVEPNSCLIAAATTPVF